MYPEKEMYDKYTSKSWAHDDDDYDEEEEECEYS